LFFTTPIYESFNCFVLSVPSGFLSSRSGSHAFYRLGATESAGFISFEYFKGTNERTTLTIRACSGQFGWNSTNSTTHR
jgi:hypothetical protein